MVDPITGAGNPANVGQVNRTQNNKQTENSPEADTAVQGDQVELSPEALEAQANDTASQTRALLEEDSGAVLSSSAQRLNQLL